MINRRYIVLSNIMRLFRSKILKFNKLHDKRDFFVILYRYRVKIIQIYCLSESSPISYLRSYKKKIQVVDTEVSVKYE